MLTAVVAESLAQAWRVEPLVRAASHCQVAAYAAWAAPAGRELKPRTQGDLPKVPTLPQRSLLLRKLVQYEQLARPPQQLEQPKVLSEKQQIRAARRAAAQQYLASIQAAAAHQDIQQLLKHLEAAQQASSAPADTAAALSAASTTGQLPHAVISSSGSSSAQLALPPSPSLLADAAAVAVRQLAAASGRPEHAQAFVELALEKQLLAPHLAQRALHAVLQAYADTGDHKGVIAAASRFFSTDEASSSSSSSSSQLLPPGCQPSSCTLALLLRSAAATRDPDLLMGAWKYFGSTWQQQQQHDSSRNSSRDSTRSSSSSSSSPLAPPVVLHALVQGSIQCDLAAAGLSSSSSSSSSLYGFAAAAAAHAVPDVGVSAAVFQDDTSTTEVLQDISHRLQQHQQLQQQKQQQKRQQQQQQREVRPQLPVPLLHPCDASQLLSLTSSTADVDLLLLSQLYQPGGLAADDMVKLVQLQQTESKQQQQKQQMLLQHTSSTQQQAAPVQQHHSIGSNTLYKNSSSGTGAVDVAMSDTPLALLLPQLDVGSLPQFPPCLRADVARAAVASYMRHGAHTRAAAIAHAAAVKNPRDIQQFHLLIRGCAAAGLLMPALVLLDKLRGYFWQAASPKAQAAMLRAMARNSSGPPLGAACSAGRLLTFFKRHCSPHPATWGALLQGFVTAGDRGPRVWKALRSAMSQPYSYMAMAGLSSEVLNRARSKIVAQLLHGILAAAEEGSRLPSVTAAGAEIVAAAAAASAAGARLHVATDIVKDEAAEDHYSSSSSSSVGWSVAAAGLAGSAGAEDRLRRALAMPAATAASVYSPASVLQAPQQQQQQQRLVSGVRLHEQPLHLRSKVLLLLTVFDVLAAWGVVLRHDAALAAGLQVLRYCWDTEDARQSGLLVAVLRSALSLGIKPSHATLHAMLSCCADLESRPGKTPLGLASGPGFNLQGVGYVDLKQVLAACEEAVQQQQQQQQFGSSAGSSKAADAAAAGVANLAAATAAAGPEFRTGSSSSSSEVQQLAADLLRTWAFSSTVEYVDGVMTHGPTWPLKQWSERQLQQQESAGGRSLLQGVGGGGTPAAVSAAVGV